MTGGQSGKRPECSPIKIGISFLKLPRAYDHVNTLPGPLPQPAKGPVQVRGPGA